MVLGRATLLVVAIGVLEHALKDRSPLLLQGGGSVTLREMEYGEECLQDLLITVLVRIRNLLTESYGILSCHHRKLRGLLGVNYLRILMAHLRLA